MKEISFSFFSAAFASFQKSGACVFSSSSLISSSLLAMSKIPPQGADALC